MKQKKTYHIIIILLICFFMNIAGRYVAGTYNLPVWLDALGTIFTAYLLGPVCGAIVGVASGIIYGILYSNPYVYCIVGAIIGISVGIIAKKKMFESLFGTLTASVIVTWLSVISSVPINWFCANREIGNIWGDGIVTFMQIRGIPYIVCVILGEFYVDFIDKVFSLFLLLVCIATARLIRKRIKLLKKRVKTTGFIFAVLVAAIALSGADTLAAGEKEQNEPENYDRYIQTIYNNTNGLNCGEANTVVQTPDGTLWIGTYAGLYRYNGTEFTWMDSIDSVYNVNCLYVDDEGRLWIGTNDSGLSIMIKNKIVNVLDVESGMASNSIRCVTESTDGVYYVGTTDGLMAITLDGGLRVLKEIDTINCAEKITSDDEGYVVTVTASGDLYIIRNKEIFTSMTLPQEYGQFTCCCFDDRGLLYVGTSGDEVRTYDIINSQVVLKETRKCRGLSSINNIFFTENGDAFVCAENGIGYFNTEGEFTLINSPEFDSSIDQVTVDYQGNYWFASSRKGLLRLCKSPFTDIYKLYGAEAKVANAVVKWQSNLYVATDDGLDIFDTDSNVMFSNELTEELDDVRIRSLMVDSQNHLWICTYGHGLMELLPNGSYNSYSSEDGTFGDKARAVIELTDGTIAAAGDTGISLIKDGRIDKNFKYGQDLSNDMILNLVQLPDGDLLAGTDGGGIIVIRDKEIVKRISADEGLSSDVILRVVPDKFGEGCFVVTSNRLCYIDKDYNPKVLENFPYFNNYDIWQDENDNLFVSGSAGIYIVNGRDVVADNDDIEYRVLDARSGLISSLTVNAWSYYDENEGLYLCTDSGAICFDMKQYNTQSKSYRMSVSAVNEEGIMEAMTRSEAFIIPKGVKKIELYPELINYSTDNPYISYRLEGFDSTETVIHQSELTSITYTNLPAGEYTFHMSVIDSGTGKVYEEGKYTIIKEKEFHENEWFFWYILFVLVLSIVWFTWFIVRTQIQRVINFQKKELEYANNQIKVTNEAIIAVARTVDAKDENTSQHSARVSEYSLLIAKELGMSDDEQENLRRAALLHDIGKIGISDNVLNKPSKLTDAEYEIMKTHVIKGAEILKDFTMVDHVIEGALYHHERYDGKGYAIGLAGEDIPLYGRIIGVADAFDAMTANRVYRKKMDIEYVMSELEKGKGTQFDPKIAEIMINLVREGKIDVEALYKEKGKSEE